MSQPATQHFYVKNGNMLDRKKLSNNFLLAQLPTNLSAQSLNWKILNSTLPDENQIMIISDKFFFLLKMEYYLMG